MLTENQAKEFAKQWIKAWNSRDIDAIMSHYDDDIILVSPLALKLLNIESGTIKGKPALKSYFAKGLEIFPGLKFELIDVMCGVHSLVLYYKNQKGAMAAEYMELGPSGKILKAVVNYSNYS